MYNKTNKVHQVFFAISKYVPEKKKSVDVRTYVGQIKNGKFTYTQKQQLGQVKKELEELRAKSCGGTDNPSDDATKAKTAKVESDAGATDATNANAASNETKASISAEATNVKTEEVENNAANTTDSTKTNAAAEATNVKTAEVENNAINTANAAKGVGVVVAKAQEEIPDRRQQSKAIYPIKYVFLVSLLSALGGKSGCVQIADYWCANRKVLARGLPDFPDIDISHDSVRRLLMLVDPSHLAELYRKLVAPLIAEADGRVVAVDGQAVKATGQGRKQNRCRCILSFYDTGSGVVIGQRLVGRKTNESTVAPDMVDSLDVDGTIVTCDALNSKPEFARKLVEGGADYCMAVKDNRRKLHIDIQLAFHDRTETGIKTFSATETGHGRVETRTVQVLPASRLPEKTTGPWLGLDEGSIVKATTGTYDKSTGINSTLDRYFITTLRFDNENIAQQCARAVRHHWKIENELHYIMDFDMNQDRSQCKNAVYLENRVRLNHLAHAIINQVRKENPERSGALKSRKRIMEALGSINFALEQLGRLYAN